MRNPVKLVMLLGICLFAASICFSQSGEEYWNSRSHNGKDNSKKDLNKTELLQKTDNNLDSLLLGYWGRDMETGNCILWIINDSIFFVDESLWCTYKLEKDTIIILIDNDSEYMKAHYKIENDKLILKTDYQTIEYERCVN
jgi:hypothetical protein